MDSMILIIIKRTSIEKNPVLFVPNSQTLYCSSKWLTSFVDIVDARMKDYFLETNLKRIRTVYGCTQAELAQQSNVSLRSIQMYEQRNKDINKASVDTVYRLAKVLGCTMEDLIEK